MIRSKLGRFVILSASIGVVLSASLFVAGPGLVDSDGRLISLYNSTGSDDNDMIAMAIPIFMITAVIVLALWKRCSVWTMVILFTAAWLLQLGLLDWIEVASILSTLHLPKGWFLVVFIAVYGLSLPTALVFAFIEYRWMRYQDMS